jgi:hypothetical protein
MIDRIEESTDHESAETAPAETTPVAEAPEPVTRKPRKPHAPRGPQSAKPKATSVEPTVITLETRLKHGYLTVNEACALAMCGRSSLYADARKGLLTLVKKGGRCRLWGPVFVKYLSGKSGE